MVRASALESLPGRELWQPYLTQSAQGAADFARDPVSALLSLLPGSPVQLLVDTLHSYADLLLFLLLLTALSFLVGDAADGTLLDLAAAGGCGVLIWGDLLTLAQSIGERMDSWRLFLTGFLPVCGAVLTAGGEGNAGAVASGFLLSVLALLAQGIALCIRPLLQSYLAISMACCIHTQTGLPEACRMSGQLLRKSISAGGKLFALLLGVQRVITLQLDHTTSRLGQMLTGSVPVIGQALSGAADTVLAGLQLLKNSLGIAALVILGAGFVPLYLGLLFHLAVLSGCRLLCSFAGIDRCRALFDCLTEAVRCMAAVTALFFSLTMVGVALMTMMNGGGNAGRNGILPCMCLHGAASAAGGSGLGAPMHKSGCGAIYSNSSAPCNFCTACTDRTVASAGAGICLHRGRGNHDPHGGGEALK